MTDLFSAGAAVFSDCGLYRMRLDRGVADRGFVFAYFGINGATATADDNDHTVTKWTGFTNRNGGARFIVGNVYAFCATDVRELANAADPVGPDNDRYLAEIIAEADILVPCWGSRAKLPPRLWPRLDLVADRIFAAAKPVKIFGLTRSGDPLHPLTLPYATPLTDWKR
ncbi:DUF1643 domain-containing protein [Rhizobium herbae]|uniref:DUF1643 domain-containing protein n=1 Tax=Rhizobium herbae TaxID=508661 RepID=A0ABS7H594_9HYPH|nr:DUF1643 domain-containing protein [Rhizobium herbae]MBW9062411.1 DUF1643 domain-containing protein [Rhizobium herbae]